MKKRLVLNIVVIALSILGSVFSFFFTENRFALLVVSLVGVLVTGGVSIYGDCFSYKKEHTLMTKNKQFDTLLKTIHIPFYLNNVINDTISKNLARRRTRLPQIDLSKTIEQYFAEADPLLNELFDVFCMHDRKDYLVCKWKKNINEMMPFFQELEDILELSEVERRLLSEAKEKAKTKYK